jgi:HSP20 family protein
MEDLAMTLVRRNTGNLFPSFLDDFLNRDWMDWGNTHFSNTNTTLPAVNIKENDKNFSIDVAAPGMKKEDFKINLDHNRLTISSERKNEKSEEKDNFSRKEFSYQSFSRSFTLPENMVDSDKIAAKYNDGILTIELPKRKEAIPKPPRSISIK